LKSGVEKRIGFVLLSNSSAPQPSTRITVLNMLPRLKASGFEPIVVFEPKTAHETPDVSGLTERMQSLRIDIAFFQKVHGTSILAEIKELRRVGIQTIYGVCDRIDEEMVRATDATVVVTDFLKQQHPKDLHPRIHVVHDGIERPSLYRNDLKLDKPKRRISAVLVTSSAPETIPVFKKIPDFLDLTVVGRYPEHRTQMQELRRRIRRALYRPQEPTLGPLFGYGFQTRPWHPERVYEHMLNADIGIIPVDMSFDPLPGREISYWQVKSENRLTLKMALGLPVIASPVPSYIDIIKNGTNGYIAYTQKDWLDALEALRDPQHRKLVGEAARASVLDTYSMDSQASKLIAVLNAVSRRNEP